MCQRLGLAAALLGDPATLILDEPTNGLDPAGIRWMRDLLRRLAAEGRTVFVSSHLLGEMQQIVDRVVVIDKGRLIADVDIGEAGAEAQRVTVRTPQTEALTRALQEHRLRVESSHSERPVTRDGLAEELAGHDAEAADEDPALADPVESAVRTDLMQRGRVRVSERVEVQFHHPVVLVVDSRQVVEHCPSERCGIGLSERLPFQSPCEDCIRLGVGGRPLREHFQ